MLKHLDRAETKQCVERETVAERGFYEVYHLSEGISLSISKFVQFIQYLQRMQKKKKSYGVFVHMFDKWRYINSECKVAQLCLGL